MVLERYESRVKNLGTDKPEVDVWKAGQDRLSAGRAEDLGKDDEPQSVDQPESQQAPHKRKAADCSCLTLSQDPSKAMSDAKACRRFARGVNMASEQLRVGVASQSVGAWPGGGNRTVKDRVVWRYPRCAGYTTTRK